MTRIRLLFLLGFVLSLGAGVVLGMVVRRAAVEGSPGESKPVVAPNPPEHKSMAAELGLTPEQDEVVKKIWSEAGAANRQADSVRFDRWHALGKERDDAILQLVPADKKADYERIQREHAAKVADLNKERDRIFQEAEQKMKALLTAEQWKRFEDRKREHGEQRDHGRNPRGPGMHGPPPPFGMPRPPSTSSNPTTDPHERPQ